MLPARLAGCWLRVLLGLFCRIRNGVAALGDILARTRNGVAAGGDHRGTCEKKQSDQSSHEYSPYEDASTDAPLPMARDLSSDRAMKQADPV
jgi:hypothetical protein